MCFHRGGFRRLCIRADMAQCAYITPMQTRVETNRSVQMFIRVQLKFNVVDIPYRLCVVCFVCCCGSVDIYTSCV